jgi:hypothetical protein
MKYKVGDKLRCIRTKGFFDLVLNKDYTISSIRRNYIGNIEYEYVCFKGIHEKPDTEIGYPIRQPNVKHEKDDKIYYLDLFFVDFKEYRKRKLIKINGSVQD